MFARCPAGVEPFQSQISFLFHMKLVFELTDKKVFEKYFMFEMLYVCNELMIGSVQEIISKVGEFIASA